MLVKNYNYGKVLYWDVVKTPFGERWERFEIPFGCLEILKEKEYEIAEVRSSE